MFMKAGLDMRPARLAPPSRPRVREKKEMREELEKGLNEDTLTPTYYEWSSLGKFLEWALLFLHAYSFMAIFTILSYFYL